MQGAAFLHSFQAGVQAGVGARTRPGGRPAAAVAKNRQVGNKQKLCRWSSSFIYFWFVQVLFFSCHAMLALRAARRLLLAGLPGKRPVGMMVRAEKRAAPGVPASSLLPLPAPAHARARTQHTGSLPCRAARRSLSRRPSFLTTSPRTGAHNHAGLALHSFLH